MPFCNKCGEKLDDNEEFCHNCGAKSKKYKGTDKTIKMLINPTCVHINYKFINKHKLLITYYSWGGFDENHPVFYKSG